jgi:hypothetical protein
MSDIKTNLKKKLLEAANLQTKKNYPVSSGRQIPQK